MDSQNQQQSSWNGGDENGLTRRRMSQALGTGAMAATVGSALNGRQAQGRTVRYWEARRPTYHTRSRHAPSRLIWPMYGC